jgi:predicted NUDIX family NTP pyrophosphohydrolase
MPRESAGLLMYRKRNGQLEFLLVHPGGPFWRNKDTGAWTIPKGGVEPGEEALETAKREFAEELGFPAQGFFTLLQPIRQKGGKLVHAWAFESDCEPATCKSNTFELEWPPRSGLKQQFPEVDKVAFFSLDEAREKINAAQAPWLEAVALQVKGV